MTQFWDFRWMWQIWLIEILWCNQVKYPLMCYMIVSVSSFFFFLCQTFKEKTKKEKKKGKKKHGLMSSFFSSTNNHNKKQMRLCSLTFRPKKKRNNFACDGWQEDGLSSKKQLGHFLYLYNKMDNLNLDWTAVCGTNIAFGMWYERGRIWSIGPAWVWEMCGVS